MAEPTRFRKLYPKDMLSSGIQKSLNKYTRIGKISRVDAEKGTCVIEWLDRPGYSTDTLLAQGSHKEWNIPEKEAVVLVSFDSKDQPRIIRYINVGHAKRVIEETLPKLKPGDKLWEAGGSFLYMKANGDILLWSQSEGIVTLENASRTFRSETVNWKVQTDVGSQFFGVISRLVGSPTGGKEIQAITNFLGQNLGEYKFQLYETDQDQSLFGSPLVELVFGTVVDDDGNQVDKDGTTVIDPSKALCLKLSIVKGSSLLELTLDKSGKLYITAPSINVNDGTNGVARKEDATLINSTTDSSFTSWIAAVDAYLRAANSAGTIGGANAAYLAAIASAPTTVDGKINEGSDSVKVGD